MNAPLPAHEAWLLDNQRLLALEFMRLKAMLRGEPGPMSPEAPAPPHEPAALDQLAALFGLSAFERDLLLLAAGVEMDAELAAAASPLNFGTALGLFGADAHWSALTPQAPLRRWRLLGLDEHAGITQGRLRIDERILHLLAGINRIDLRLGSCVQPQATPTSMAPSQRLLAQQIAHTLQATPRGTVLLAGDDASGQLDVAAAAAAALGLRLHRLAWQDLPEHAAERQALALLWQREAALLGSALALTGFDAPDAHRLAHWLAPVQERGLVFVCAADAPPLPQRLSLRVDKPGAAEQRALWQQALGSAAPPVLLDRLASQFRLGTQELIERAAAVNAAEAPEAAAQRLWQHCRQAARPRLEGLAQAVPSRAGWDQLVLPDSQRQLLMLIASQLRHRQRVLGDWGFAAQGARGLGLAALFFGDSGVGKTLACEVLAHELELDLYRIDLSAVVSKYIGETEKNLRRVFDAAEDSGAILLFDEADALFGKRSEVRDSHDRYANIEVGYLLQRMEAYRGLAVLTTNQRGALDSAFLRRLRFVVQFPFPDQAQREQIWRRLMPDAMPRGEIDFAKLARLPLAGGAIRNIVLNAAFMAAADDAPVQMAHLAHAAQLEAGKQERPMAENQTRAWA